MKEQHPKTPPRWIYRFLSFFCKGEFLEEIGGDLEEIFKANCQAHGTRNAKWRYAWNVLRFFKWSNIKKTTRFNSNNVTMTRNNFKIAARVLWRQKVNTLLNVT